MVTNYNMSENEMGNLGSKSEIITAKLSVKEQRVDGSYLFKHNKLRCTLMDCESNYPVKIPSNQIIHKKHYSSININISTNHSTLPSNTPGGQACVAGTDESLKKLNP